MHARRTRAEHTWPKLQNNRALAELYVNGSFTEDRGAWEKELQRHCVEVYVDPEETVEEQGKQNYEVQKRWK